jgi:hypothetical protein
MKMITYRKMAMMLGAMFLATLAVGCYSGSGYSNDPYGNNSSYGSSYPYRSSGYSYPQTYGNAYNAGYQNGARADANRDRREDRVTDQRAAAVNRDRVEARTQTAHSSVDRDKDSEPASRIEKN